MTEAEFQAQIVQLAKMCGWRVYHTHDSRRSEPGFPDLVLARSGTAVLFREVKTETGKLSEAQAVWIHLLTQAGADAGVWRPSDWDTIREQLQRKGTHP